jgi:hypothetical protein
MIEQELGIKILGISPTPEGHVHTMPGVEKKAGGGFS